MSEKIRLYKTAREVFEEATTLILGSSACRVVYFHLKQRIGRDPYEVLLEKPEIFYEEYENLFSKSVDLLLNYVGNYIVERYGVDCSPQEFVKLLQRGGESSKDKMTEIMAKIYEKSKKK